MARCHPSWKQSLQLRTTASTPKLDRIYPQSRTRRCEIADAAQVWMAPSAQSSPAALRARNGDEPQPRLDDDPAASGERGQ